MDFERLPYFMWGELADKKGAALILEFVEDGKTMGEYFKEAESASEQTAVVFKDDSCDRCLPSQWIMAVRSSHG